MVSSQPVPPRFEDSFIALLKTTAADRQGRAATRPRRPAGSPHARDDNGTGPVIEVHDVQRRFGNFYAVNDISFHGRAGRGVRPAGRQRRGQVHHLPHAVRPVAGQRRHPARRRG